MKVLEKVVKVFFIIAILFSMVACSNNVFAANEEGNNVKGIEDIVKAGNSWLSGEQANQPEGTGVDDFVFKFVGIGRALVVIGIVTIMIVTLIMGIRWIVATPDKQAKLKEQLIGLVVATVVIFGAVGIWNLVRGIMQRTEDTISSQGSTQIVANMDGKI